MPATDLETIYDEHAPALFAFLLNLTRNETETRDLLQEVFVKLAKQPGMLKSARDNRAFLIRLAHNLAIDSMRRRQTRERNYEQFAVELDFIFCTSANPDEEEFRRELAEALGALPAEQRAVVHLKL